MALHVWSKALALVPWAMFAGTLGAVAWVNGSQGFQRPVLGFAQAESENLASLEAGRLLVLAVETGQDVAGGQVVARLDPAGVDAELALAEAERRQLQAAMASAGTEARRQQTRDAKEYGQWLTQTRVELSREEVALQQAQAQERSLRAERERLQKLVTDKLATASDLARVEIQYQAVAREVEERPRTVALLRAQLAASESLERRAPGGAASQVAAMEPVQRELDVLTQKVEWLKQRRQGLELRAPHGGRVAAVLRRPGEVVGAGEPVVTLVRQRAGRLSTCVLEQDALRLRAGDVATVWPRHRSSGPLRGRAVSLGPLVDEVPVRCRRVPTMPVWGRDVTVQLDEPLEMVAGEAFDVRFEPAVEASPLPAAPESRPTPGPAVATGAVQLLASAGPLPGLVPVPLVIPEQPTPDAARTMTVPEELAAAWHVEPSGMLWRGSLGRFVVVSDDTGTRGDTRHAPVLFGLAMDGTLDREPLPVHGVSELNDLESVAAEDDGTLYLLASQSFSRTGHRKAGRTAFLQLAPAGRGYDVTGEVHLAELLEGLGAKRLEALGLPGSTRDLEIEGMTAWQGALYLGLKGPVDGAGHALVWRLEHPKALFASGRLEDAGLSLWARVKLDADLDGRTVPGGISELLFLPDGALLLASTPTGDVQGAESGRLWTVARPGPGTLDARLVRSFPGLKPEALSLSPTPGHLVVAFDEGGRTPRWLEMPWPP